MTSSPQGGQRLRDRLPIIALHKFTKLRPIQGQKPPSTPDKKRPQPASKFSTSPQKLRPKLGSKQIFEQLCN